MAGQFENDTLPDGWVELDRDGIRALCVKRGLTASKESDDGGKVVWKSRDDMMKELAGTQRNPFDFSPIVRMRAKRPATADQSNVQKKALKMNLPVAAAVKKRGPDENVAEAAAKRQRGMTETAIGQLAEMNISSAATHSAVHPQNWEKCIRLVEKILLLSDRNWHGCSKEIALVLPELRDVVCRLIEEAVNVCDESTAAPILASKALKAVAEACYRVTMASLRVSPKFSTAAASDTMITLRLHGGDQWMMSHAPMGLLEVAWPILLERVAANPAVPDTVLLRLINDSVHSGCLRPHVASTAEKLFTAGLCDKTPRAANGAAPVGLDPPVCAARDRLKTLYARVGEWSSLGPKMEQLQLGAYIDRRYNGPIGLRRP